MRPADRADIPPFYVMEVMKAAAERERTTGDVLHLEVGQPSTPAPLAVRDAAARALESNRLGYTDAVGIPELRERIAQRYLERYGVDVPAARVAVTMGASGSFVLAFLAAFDVGDRVAVTEPGYPCSAYNPASATTGRPLKLPSKIGREIGSDSRGVKPRIVVIDRRQWLATPLSELP